MFFLCPLVFELGACIGNGQTDRLTDGRRQARRTLY